MEKSMHQQLLMIMLCVISVEMLESSAQTKQSTPFLTPQEVQQKASDELAENAIFKAAKKYGNDYVAKILVDEMEGTSESLSTNLMNAIIDKRTDIVVMLLRSPRLNKVFLNELFTPAIIFGQIEAVELLLTSGRFNGISEQDLKALLLIAQEGIQKSQSDQEKYNYTGIIHLLNAYTALKPEDDLFVFNEYGKKVLNVKYPELAIIFIEAYKEFLNGRPNDLRNLVFPLVDDIYAIAAKKDIAGISMRMIRQSLVSLFKADHIKSLLFTLVDKESQKKVAIDLLRNMGSTELQLPQPRIFQHSFQNRLTYDTPSYFNDNQVTALQGPHRNRLYSPATTASAASSSAAAASSAPQGPVTYHMNITNAEATAMPKRFKAAQRYIDQAKTQNQRLKQIETVQKCIDMVKFIKNIRR